MILAALLLLAMVAVVTADVLLRNLVRTGFAWSNEISEYALYAVTLLTAPWLLRRGQHVRLDLVLTQVPARVAWLMEAMSDICGFAVSMTLVCYGVTMTLQSWRLGSITIKTLVFPEWWLLWPLPLFFALLAVEFIFRMHRLLIGERTRRAEATSVTDVSWGNASLILFGGLVVLMGVGLPVAYAFLAINIAGALIFLGGEQGLVQLSRNAVVSVTSFSLTPIPFFMLMGEVLFHTGVAMKGIDAIALIIRRVPGRLSVIAIVAGTVFSAISGSSIATTAMLGSLMLPTMLARGYHPRMAMGPIIGIGGVDMLIPPSALAVLLGSLAGISISQLLIGGIMPGLLLSVVFVGYIIFRAWLNPALAPENPDEVIGPVSWRPLFIYVLPLVAIFAVVVGAMVAGWATPTEAAALGAAATIAAAACYRALTFDNLLKALKGAVTVSGVILFIIVGATTFSQVLSFSGATNGIVALVTQQGLSPAVVLTGMLLILLFLGSFVDQVSMMMITLPFFMPLVQKYGFDPLWFGVQYLICMQLGFLHPPFGLLLVTMKGVAPPHIPMSEVIWSGVPYLLFGLLALVLVVVFPPLATWLPSLMH